MEGSRLLGRYGRRCQPRQRWHIPKNHSMSHKGNGGTQLRRLLFPLATICGKSCDNDEVDKSTWWHGQSEFETDISAESYNGESTHQLSPASHRYTPGTFGLLTEPLSQQELENSNEKYGLKMFQIAGNNGAYQNGPR